MPLNKRTCLRSAHSYTSGRYFLPRMSYSLGSVSSSQCVFFLLAEGHFNAYICQAAKDARASQDILIDIFERIEMFFRRLEIYTELPSTMEMMDTIIQVMAEVLSILGIATKEIRQGRMSKCLVYEYENVDRRMFRKICEDADRED